MSLRNSAQVVACFLNLNQSFTNLYQLKFTGRKLLEEIVNAFWQKNKMAKQAKGSLSHRDNIIFKTAVANCSAFITGKIAAFEEEFINKYVKRNR